MRGGLKDGENDTDDIKWTDPHLTRLAKAFLHLNVALGPKCLDTVVLQKGHPSGGVLQASETIIVGMEPADQPMGPHWRFWWAKVGPRAIIWTPLSWTIFKTFCYQSSPTNVSRKKK